MDHANVAMELAKFVVKTDPLRVARWCKEELQQHEWSPGRKSPSVSSAFSGGVRLGGHSECRQHGKIQRRGGESD